MRTLRCGNICALVVTFVLALPVGQAEALRPSPGCGRAELATGRKIERRIGAAGVERDYILDVPDSIAAGTPVPLMFDFHGFGHSGAGVWNVSGFKPLAERDRFITVYPTGLPITLELRGESHTGPGWEMRASADNRDLAFTVAMLEAIERDYCIDLDRVFSTGFSNGAFFSSLLGCRMSDRFAAIAPVSGGVLRDPCEPSRPVPVMIQHGTRDDLIPVARARAGRDQWLAANGCKPASQALETAPRCERYATCRTDAVVVYCEEDFAHRWPAQATERIWTFFQTHPRVLGANKDPR